MPRTDSVDPIASLRHRGYLFFLLGSLLSNTGNQMRAAAVNWEVYLRTGRALDLGYVGLILALPVILFALPAGTAADRYSRRGLIMMAQAGLALCGVGLAWASITHAPLPIVFALLFGTGTFRALGWPASSAIVTGMVPNSIFANAAMWRSVMFQIAASLGPLLGGFLLALWSPAAVYLIDAASSLILITVLMFVHPRPHQREAEPKSWTALMQGIRFLRRQPILISSITLDMIAVLFGGAVAMLPIYAKEVLHVEALGYGWLRAMPSVGAIFMALLLAVRPPFKRGGATLFVAVVTFGLATLVFAISKSFPLSLAALFVLGAADNISVVIRSTVLQLLTPDSMRGRVTAVSVIFISTSNEIGEFESGVAAQWLGLIPSVVFGGVMTLVTVGVVGLIWPELV
ncbi:MAG TPA: MFS transporter, partial [Lacipirellulaceae bacterium]|nr:MFS transporter [Lacipirellulaceae bacterium]